MPISRPLPSTPRRWHTHLLGACSLSALLLTGPSPWGVSTAALLPPSAPSAPQPLGALHEEILRLLDSPDSTPRAADWAPLGPEALTELTGLANNPKAPEPQRTRAVAAMAVVAHPEASQRLQGLLRSPASPDSVRAAATLALSRREGLEVIPLLTPLLSDHSDQVRATAARTLGRLGGPEARRVLEERLPFEEDLAVREAIQQGLSYIEP
ncbi:HEAT repeat domain-containing protein [Vitiosangium sp. GDMCC 1.1324]|uniref:HEAT repeat domain-containing protein n=1 Tax=Vitiosangium sp. (strain GDMCC 1.1324) TaxID=2138576 RepID=UPI000D39942C|nr:HEAT repeat domain-containing protein [Vitiosangium sp. GDMCC 1.1324]PTL78355.1 HEAT repeat domain-containing protein [Vitiosangium sp. GDMCC 1.1324]